jgi:hypothetical protein
VARMINRGYTMGECTSALLWLLPACSANTQQPHVVYLQGRCNARQEVGSEHLRPLLLRVVSGVGGMDQAPPIKIKPQAEGKVRHTAAHHMPQQTCFCMLVKLGTSGLCRRP